MEIIAQYFAEHGEFALRMGILLVVALGALAWDHVGIGAKK